MLYLVANKDKAVAVGVNIHTHRNNKSVIILNEKEVMGNLYLEGDITERAEQLESTIYTETELKYYMNKVNWDE